MAGLTFRSSGTAPNKMASASLNNLSSGSPSWSFVSKLATLKLAGGLWSIAALLDLAISFSGGGTLATIFRVTFTYCCGFGLSFVEYRLSTRKHKSVADFSLPRILLIAIPSGSILFLIDVFGRSFAHGHSPFQAWPLAYVLRLRPMWSYFTMLFVFQSTIIWLTTSAQTLELRERQLLEARLAALRLQLNPHFLFNTLNAILTLAREAGAVEAEQMIMRLSDFLQVTLEDEPAVLVPLAAEIDMIQAYLAIEAVRFGDRLIVSYACDASLADAQVPSFILQPLVENAVKYAVSPSTEPVTLRVEAKSVGNDLLLKVEDDGRSKPEVACAPGSGVGIRNIASRLEALYGAAASIEASRREVGFTAVMRLPLTRAV